MSEEHCVEATSPRFLKLQFKTKDYSQMNKDAHETKADNGSDIIEHMLESGDLLAVENLSLCENKLHCLPCNFGECFNNLSRLDLSNNYLKNLPPSLSLLKNLQHLSLKSNQFSILPKVIGTLSNLQSLNACNNEIRDIASNVGDLVNLKDLDLSSNKLISLPSALAKLCSLEYLSLAYNNFKEVPQCITTGLTNLRILDLSGNKHLRIDAPPRSTNLIVFYARNNNVCLIFPNWILNPMYHKLEVIELDNTNFKTFNLPEEMPFLHIRSLSMKQCKLSEAIVLKIITRMVYLEKIVIGNDQMLKEISICCAGIPAIPDIIGNFINLKAINVSDNTISWMPDEICTLKNLESLIINNNNVAILPSNIGDLISLKELKANCNNIACLPDSIKYLTKLEYLDLYNNEIQSFPESIERMSSLLGLDFGYNFFSTENILIRGICYEKLKVTLREHWPKDNRIPDEPKSEQPANTCNIIDNNESFSCWFDNVTDSDVCSVEVRDASSDNDLAERWDVSEDSSDEFDPTEHTEHRIHSRSEFTFYSVPRHTFCPAFLHKKRVMEKVVEMVQNGSLVWTLDYEEGQFEDP
ncbi:hypothetical protein KM043_017108 [Ampulex compressa]|nr:hypothetical protein KM043_017108 [Ampulex compressa]